MASLYTLRLVDADINASDEATGVPHATPCSIIAGPGKDCMV
ncbi:hypothetical protein [Pseudomonas taeanensis]|nr:hypothetical protein [Pseudomonas taeanensis]